MTAEKDMDKGGAAGGAAAVRGAPAVPDAAAKPCRDAVAAALEAQRVAPARHLTELMRAASVTGPRGVTLREHEFAVQIGLRAEPGSPSGDALEEVLGVPLPRRLGEVTGDPDGLHVLWLAPDEFLAVDVSRRQWPGEDAPYRAALEELPGQAVELSANRTILVLEGPSARAVLDKSVQIDLAPRAFPVPRAEATLLGTGPVVLMRADAETWRILPRASFADYTVRWLADGMAEFAQPAPEEESAAASVRPAQYA